MKLKLVKSIQYGLTIFLSAFLLFQIQPIVGKIILPWFGGSASVWTICMLFFQATLLLGYSYSHLVIKLFKPIQQSFIHITLLIFSALMLPFAPSEYWKPTGDEDPSLLIIGLLTVCIGLPYLTLATTGPLVQAWFTKEEPGKIPYRLFALSNFGSLIGLLTYPTIFEISFSTTTQSHIWSALYFLFAINCALLAWGAGKNHTEEHSTNEKVISAIKIKQLLLWILLAACPSILLVANTAFLTENIAPVPLLWIGPLALYLLSFIICFEKQKWYLRKFFLPCAFMGLLALAWLPVIGLDQLPINVSIPLYLISFFFICMVCHGELAKQKPENTHLTIYYLMIAVGGLIGGLFVGVMAPHLFTQHYELSVGIIISAIIVSFIFLSTTHFKKRFLELACTSIAFCYLATIFGIRYVYHLYEFNSAKISQRNFYGIVKVSIDNAKETKSMLHGRIIHGSQSTDPSKEGLPTTYYTEDSGIGIAIKLQQSFKNSIKVGVIGLGVGTLATYGRSSDHFKFYEINPIVISFANQEFSYLSNSSAKIETILGDARIKLNDETPQNYDILAIDAFSGDAIPVHLLTLEAFQNYLNHLNENGILAIHISNRYLDLKPVIKAVAEKYKLEAKLVLSESLSENGYNWSSWILIAKNQAFFQSKELSKSIEIKTKSEFKAWTDNYSNILSIFYYK